jgi:hypothetical protein
LLRYPEGFMLARGMVRKVRVSVGKFAVLLAFATSCARTELFFECTPGEARFCDANGQVGAQTCSYLGHWGTCNENDSEGSGARSGGTGPSAGAASGSGATSGSGGKSGSAGAGGVAGEGGALSEGGEGGAPSDGGAGGSAEIECDATDCETTVEFERLFGVDGPYVATDVSVNGHGEVAIAVMGKDGSIDFGGVTEPMHTDDLLSVDNYLARFDGDGASLWATAFDEFQGYLMDHVVSRIDLDDDGDLFVAGMASLGDDVYGSFSRFQGTSSKTAKCGSGFSNGAGRSIAGTGDGGFVGVGLGGGTDLETAKTVAMCDAFESDCEWRWGPWLPSAGPAVAGSVATSVALDSSGNVIFVGASGGPVELGDDSIGSPNNYSILLVKLASSGARIFARAFSGEGVARRDAQAVAIDSHDNIFVAGVYDSSLDLGAGPLPSKSGSYLAKFDPEGQLIWARQLAGSKQLEALDIDVDPSDNVLVAATFEGDLEKPIVASAVDRDGIVLKIAPEGDAVWVKVFGGANDQSARGVAAAPDGNVFVVGGFTGPGSAALSRAFLTKLAP